MKAIRKLLLATAAGNPGVGTLTETLKWGEPAYLTNESKSGSTVRVAWKQKRPEHIGIFFNCRTLLVDEFRSRFPELEFEGNRAILLPLNEPLPTDTIESCLQAALTYHLRKRRA